MSELCSVLRAASPKRVGPRESMLLGSKLTSVSSLIDSREINVKRLYEPRTSVYNISALGSSVEQDAIEISNRREMVREEKPSLGFSRE
ncbi:hypothetical protein NC652_034467 [Populus alba x Populus x berolinensis]|uniref:Uncharacterized protein n=1 Tax=Populus alba x Populus x berolinensis TaxID=444605 RepID=A0AAD6LMF5_9ROSI|nr:hypothetical protein NC652_034467 [Populus alba x Populus x berolinensis]KAJ6969828.1 hypothetical protein NC653_034397 [Populus alba x Populus x berolinensis]